MKYLIQHLKATSIILLMLVVISSCNQSKNKDQINVLVSLPLTGDAAAYGKLLMDGVNYGLSELDTAISSKINVIYQDDKLSSKEAVNIINQEMAKQKISVAMTSSTELAMTIAPICNKNRIILLPPIADGADITKNGEYIYLLTPVSTFQAKELARYISKDGHSNVAVIYLNDSWGNSLSSIFKTEIKDKYNGSVVFSESCNPGQRDFRTQLSKLKNKKPDATLIILHPTETIPLIKQMKELNINCDIYGGDTFSNKALYTEEIIDLVHGIKFTLPSQPENKIYQSFKKGFQKKYGYSADINAAAARDAITLIGLAIEQGAINGTEIKDKFQSWKDGIEGATGLIRWNENRNVISKKYSKYLIKENHYELVGEK